MRENFGPKHVIPYLWALKSLPLGFKPCPPHGFAGECCAGGETSPAVAEQLAEVQDISATSKAARGHWGSPKRSHGTPWCVMTWWMMMMMMMMMIFGGQNHAHDLGKRHVLGFHEKTRPRDRMGYDGNVIHHDLMRWCL